MLTVSNLFSSWVRSYVTGALNYCYCHVLPLFTKHCSFHTLNITPDSDSYVLRITPLLIAESLVYRLENKTTSSLT